MYAIAIVRYRSPLEQVLQHIDEHRAYLRDLERQGLLLASGPLEPRNGGALLLNIPDDKDTTIRLALDRIRDNDPFVKAGIAQYELLPWAPVVGKERLDSLQEKK